MTGYQHEPIAIIGSAYRFAGGIDSPEKLWEILEKPPDLCQTIPEDRFHSAGFYHPEGNHGRSNVRHAYFLRHDISRFDAEFFNINPVEARAMDPQQRLSMEVVFEALESGGVTDSLRGSDTGVYVRSMSSDYSSVITRDLSDLPTYAATGMAASMQSNRLSYFFDWHGPSITLDTACSSSLTAVHLAVQSLRSGECRAALACGSNLIIAPDTFIVESKLHMLSPEGRSRMWDQNANGYARGDGVAALVLKTLRAALKDGDHVECVIRETALNQDGASKSMGITIPNAQAQEALIRSTYSRAGLDINDPKDRPQFFEAHGTGTRAGDPIEAQAVHNVFSAQHNPEFEDISPVYVGSVKTVLGHTEGTAGIAALMKASLSLQHGIIPPNLLFDRLSDAVAPFYDGLEIATVAKAWPPHFDGHRRASVNSFGFGGSNSHAILESYTEAVTVQEKRDGVIFSPYIFSAHSYKSTKLGKAQGSGGIGVRGSGDRTRGKILGVFTGQGAQYPGMAAELIENSHEASKIVDNLEAALNDLPDSPQWSLRAEILMEASQSRVYEAAISQPICTAVQILLVDLLNAADIKFDAVVGHSSGEIAAAYAAGYLSARDAMCIAYYRGLHLFRAQSPNGTDHGGGMLAVNTTSEDLQELFDDPVFSGRASIACHNSPVNYTISGDDDALCELQTLLNDEKKFNRRLRVDKAYHSAHMIPCSQPYMDSLRHYGISINHPPTTCTWISNLTSDYWAENLTRPVLFSDALREALRFHDNKYNLILEIGAHPALQGPALQIIQQEIQLEIPYTGVLKRGENSIQAFSNALGFAWERIGGDAVRLDRYDQFLSGRSKHPRLVKGLPTYHWNHERSYWHESRVSRKLRNRGSPHHILLGDLGPDSGIHNMSWKNRLYLNELECMSGHRVQGQIVFPAAGYLSTALEAAKLLSIDVGKPMHRDRISTAFTYSAVLFSNTEEITLMATSPDLLPKNKPDLPHLIDVETERFYQSLSDLGYDFSGCFKSLSELKRLYLNSSCLVKIAAPDELLIHPSELDALLQSCMLAYSYPYDGQLRGMYLPTTIEHCRINPAALAQPTYDYTIKRPFILRSTIRQERSGNRGKGAHAAIQMQRATFLPIESDLDLNNRKVFSKTHWLDASVNDQAISDAIPLTAEYDSTVLLLERISTFYLRSFDKLVAKHKKWRSEWLQDTLEDILDASKAFNHMVDVEIMHLIGPQMPRVFRGETTMLEKLRGSESNGVLDRYYANGIGLVESAKWVSLAINQIADRYPNMNIMEIGAGTGGATKAILHEIGDKYRSYTYTDISAAFFENAAMTFSREKEKMEFQVFDVESDPAEQNFVEGTYDLVVAFFVLHATKNIEAALRNIRRLLRPGGYLVVGEGRGGQDNLASSGFIFGALPGWWLGAGQDCRDLSPNITPEAWSALLHKTGFSGPDSHVPSSWEQRLNVYNFVAQAVDDEVRFLREPLAASTNWQFPRLQSLVIVGGKTSVSQNLVKDISILLAGFASHIITARLLTDIDLQTLHDDSNTADISQSTFEMMKTLFGSGNRIFWVTTGCSGAEPFCNMTIGFGRVAANESPDLRLQYLDVLQPQSIKPEFIAESFLRFYASEFQSDCTLWSLEPELVLKPDGRQLLPRLRTIKEINKRYSSNEKIRESLPNIRDSPINISLDSDGYFIKSISPWAMSASRSPSYKSEPIELHISHAMLAAVRTPLGYKFLCLGQQGRDGKQFLALAATLSSLLTFAADAIAPIEIPLGQEQNILVAITARLVAFHVLDHMYSGQTLLTYDAPSELNQAFLDEAAIKDIQVISCRTEPDVFVGFADADGSNTAGKAVISSILPTHCRVETKNTLFSANGSSSGTSITSVLGDFLRRSLQRVQKENHNQPETNSLAQPLIDLSAIAGISPLYELLTCISFTCETELLVRSTRLHAELFFKEKYATRRPEISQDWIIGHKKRGVTVSVIPCNITIESEVTAARDQIRRKFPPIAGVINGAMVLRNVTIRNMSFEELTDVVKPKVNGSIYLDRLFYRTSLDFFVLVSSLNCVIGSSGQANYAAANTFMCSLAAQRRKRGFRASVVNAGAIIGAGYMERESRRALDGIVQKLCLMRLSEEDWHQAIAEAIDAGRLDSDHGPELTTGLSDIPLDTPNRPPWSLNPNFSEFVIDRKQNRAQTQKTTTSVSVEDRLRQGSTVGEVHHIVRGAFAERLRNILQVTMTNDNIMASRSSHLGIDSLISVDIRSWFLKAMQVNVPVLRVMGNDKMENIADYAVRHVPTHIIPLIHKRVDGENINEETEGNRYWNLPETTVSNNTSHSCIDWEIETAPSMDCTATSPVLAKQLSHPPRVIVLTGATGLLGHHLLEHLLKYTSVELVHCLAIRRLSTRLQKEELLVSPRVEYHEGDLSDPYLGLSEQEAGGIFAVADAVVHNGADTSHVKHYHDLRDTNTGSTKALTRLCLSRRIPIHYISSAGVSIYYNQPTFPPVSVNSPEAIDLPRDGRFGYGCSKWVNERFLERTSLLSGLRVFIYRPSTIIREKGPDASEDRAQLDWVNALLFYIRKLGAAPEIKHNRGALDLDGDITCATTADDGTMPTYTNSVGDVTIQLNQLRDIDLAAGSRYDLLPIKDWTKKAVGVGLHPGVALLIEEMDLPGMSNYPRLLRGGAAWGALVAGGPRRIGFV
ncbi:putative polyketide synthase [Nemania sp. FL0916]|nr:putative polyketide synthase [Nemania sp. FL0916]